MERNKVFITLFIGSIFLAGLVCAPPASYAQTKKVVKVGCPVEMTGATSYEGRRDKAAFDLAVEHINASQQYPFKLEAIWADSEFKIPVAINVTEKMALMDKVDVINGPISSSLSVALAPTLKQHKLAMLVPVAKSAKNWQEGGGYIFTVGANDDQFIEFMAKAVIDKVKPKKVAFLYVTNESGIRQCDNAYKFIEKAGIKITEKTPVTVDLMDYHPIASRLKGDSPDLIWPSIQYPMIIKLARALNEVGVKQKYITAGWWDPKMFEEAPELFDGFLTLDFFWPENPDPKVQNFIKTFQAKYDYFPDKWAALSYDTAWTIAEAAKVGGPSREGILKGIPQVDFMGVTGRMRFDARGFAIDPPAYLYQYQHSLKKRVFFAKQ